MACTGEVMTRAQTFFQRTKLVSPRGDLEITVKEYMDELRGAVVYAADLYEEKTIARMVGHWERVLEGMVEDAERRGGIPMIPPHRLDLLAYREAN